VGVGVVGSEGVYSPRFLLERAWVTAAQECPVAHHEVTKVDGGEEGGGTIDHHRDVAPETRDAGEEIELRC
jgi:hypothetical protein